MKTGIKYLLKGLENSYETLRNIHLVSCSIDDKEMTLIKRFLKKMKSPQKISFHFDGLKSTGSDILSAKINNYLNLMESNLNIEIFKINWVYCCENKYVTILHHK